jgi:hypothetical protein
VVWCCDALSWQGVDKGVICVHILDTLESYHMTRRGVASLSTSHGCGAGAGSGSGLGSPLVSHPPTIWTGDDEVAASIDSAVDFVMVIGDDTADEDMFTKLQAKMRSRPAEAPRTSVDASPSCWLPLLCGLPP